MTARCQAKGNECRAIIREGVMFFSDNGLSDAKPIPVKDHLEWVLGVALAQYLITAGLKKFKDKGEKGVTKELTQMHDMSVFRPVMKDTLSKEERSKALASLMFLKEKRDKSVKARMCADGRKQRGIGQSRNPRHLLFPPGAFLHADSDEDITMILNSLTA
jgi:hypothetical protein